MLKNKARAHVPDIVDSENDRGRMIFYWAVLLLVLWLSPQHNDYNQEREIACVSVLRRKSKQGL